MTALEAARAHLHRNHRGDARHAMWKARQREYELEPLPIDIVRIQPDGFAWVAATSDQDGITVTDSGGAVVLVPWDSILTTTKPKKEHA